MLLALGSGSLLVWAWSPLPPTLPRGPYLQNASATRITVVLRTSPASTSTLRYGKEIGPPWEFETSDASATTHVFTLTELAPGTRYFYEIASGGAVVAGGAEHSFRTAPPENSRAPLRFLAWGDSGFGSSTQLAVARRMEQVVPPPQLLLGLGDLVYDRGEWENYDPNFFRPYGKLLTRTTFWPTLGNHDYKTQSGAPYHDAFYLPTRSGAPSNPSNTEKYYSFDHGMAHFTCVDSESSDSSPGGTMYRWISDDLDHARARGKRWLFAYMHHPPYSRGTSDSDLQSELIELRQNLVPLFEAKGVDMVLVGHSHVYERSFLAKNHGVLQNNASDYSKIGSPDGTIYLVSGCGGRRSSGPLDHPLMSVSRGDVAGFNIIDVTWEELRGAFVESDGSTTDLFTVHKVADVLAPRVAHVQASSSNEVELVFDEPVRGGSTGSGAENLAHYALLGGAVTDATLQSDQRTVTLATTNLWPHHLKQMVVQGVADTAGNVDASGRILGIVLTSPGGRTPVVPRGATWRYAEETLPASWTAPAFDDSAWGQGRAGFGYADGDDATVLTDMPGSYLCVYLRTSFSLVDPASVTDLVLNIDYDDGFVAFLNGVEVARANVPTGQTFTTPASLAHEAGTFEAFDLGAFRSALVAGTNVLAVEGHNSYLASADFSLHPELVLTRSSTGGGSGGPPTAVLSCDVQEANVPAQVFFSAALSRDPDGGRLHYVWGFGDGTFGFGPRASHAYARVGTYTVLLLVRDAQGLDALATHTLRVHAEGTAPLAGLSANRTQVQAGGRVDFDSAGSLDPDGGALSIRWDFGQPMLGPANESALARPSHVFPTPGNYVVTLAVTDDEGSTATRYTRITVY